MQPWMRKEVLTKFGRTVKNRWSAKSSPQNPFSHPFRGDIAPLPVNKRIRFWKLARGDRVWPAFQASTIDGRCGWSEESTRVKKVSFVLLIILEIKSLSLE
jgi:hypothetical protein